MVVGKIQMSFYLPKEIGRQFKVELARREMKVTSWVEGKVREELEALEAFDPDAGQPVQ